ncbi:30S ribosomal protein S20 [Candidatus Peregrinibacteria bacterium]|nr:MAG: 30S ribosomal protein S20 [Candidatus Peregrinibacteria bacterium]
MPITKQAIKRVKQDKTRTQRNRHYNSHMKSMIKLILGLVKSNESDKAVKMLPKAVSAIDTCAKKNIIHQNNAARKKSRIERALSAAKSVKSTATSKKEEVKA